MDVAAIASAIATSYIPEMSGRPSAIADTARIQILLAEMNAGVHLEPAANLAGLALSTVNSWMKRGAEEEAQGLEGPHVAFRRAVNACRASVEARVTRNILTASEKPAFWAAGMTYLERTSPERWARPSDRQDRAQSAIEVHVHGISTGEVSIGIAPLNATQSYQQPRILKDSDSDHLLHQQAVTSPQGSEIVTGGGAMHRGAPPPAGGPTPHAAQTRENRLLGEAISYVATPDDERKTNSEEKTNTKQDGTTQHVRTYEADAVEDGLTPWQRRRAREKLLPVNPAAERRRLALKNENAKLRRKKKRAKKLADALRHRAAREARSKKDEAALPEDVTG